MKNAILAEKNLHPQALPQDYIKLIFQSEFGPGHLISDSAYAYNRLISEWQQVKDLAPEDNQDIGGGYIRVCIKGMDSRRLEELNTAFVASANEKRGTEAGIMAKINLFLDMVRAGELPFDHTTAKQAVDKYLNGGIRPTSHTETYHRYYAPAYRVIRG